MSNSWFNFSTETQTARIRMNKGYVTVRNVANEIIDVTTLHDCAVMRKAKSHYLILFFRGEQMEIRISKKKYDSIMNSPCTPPTT